jgi:RND superfamily putative drug exporter
VLAGLGCLPLLAFRSLGIAPATAVALDAFVLRTLLVPALTHLLGAADRWPRRAGSPGRVPVDELRKEERHDVRDIAR